MRRSLATHTLDLSLEDLDRIAAGCDRLPVVRWSEPMGGGIESGLGIGAVDELIAADAATALALPDACRRRLALRGAPGEQDPPLRYFGGIAFDPAAPPHPSWPTGSPARFVLPEILLRMRSGESRASVAVTRVAGAGSLGSAEASGESIRRLVARSIEAARSSDIDLRPIVPAPEARERWHRGVRSVLAEIENGTVRKVVLSRDLVFVSRRGIPFLNLLQAMRAVSSHHTGFLFRFDRDSAFLGATPESLVRQVGLGFSCDCIAGTAPRSTDPERDARLAASLLESVKERREQAMVREGILEELRPLAERLEAEEQPRILDLPGLRHLSSLVTGRLRDGVSLGELLSALHPTPAVCGLPRERSRRMIRDLEGRSRGWYAGPIGWVDLRESHFAVGIRSAMLNGPELTLIAGAGIVEGSDPESEWEETRAKAASLLRLFTEAQP